MSIFDYVFIQDLVKEKKRNKSICDGFVDFLLIFSLNKELLLLNKQINKDLASEKKMETAEERNFFEISFAKIRRKYFMTDRQTERQTKERKKKLKKNERKRELEKKHKKGVVKERDGETDRERKGGLGMESISEKERNEKEKF